MITILLANGEDLDTISISRGGLRARLRTWCAGTELDCRLAQGASPDSSVPLSIRARRLMRPKNRRCIARGLRRVASSASASPHPGQRQVPLARAEIRECSRLMEELAGLLDGGQPVDPRGIARAELLLSEGNSPLYKAASGERLEPALRRAIDDLTTPPEILALS
jgi:hypothetical protein